MYFQTGQVIFVPEWPKWEFVSILASFCVWTKSLKCKDAVNRDSTIHSLQVKRIQVPCQPSGRSSHPIRTAKTDQHHPSGRRDHSVQTLYCIEKGLSSLHPSGLFSRTFGRLSVIDQFLISFQVPRKGRSINRPDDVVSRPDARLLKARIIIQILPSRRLTVLVRTCVHQRRKLPIRLQPSRRLLLMVRTHALQIWKLGVEELSSGCSSPWSGRAKPYKEITCSGRATVRTMCHPVRTKLLNKKDFLAKFSENLVAQLSFWTAHVHRPDSA
jgi:hypothetical protein